MNHKDDMKVPIVEYILILALIAVVSIAALNATGTPIELKSVVPSSSAQSK